MPSLLKCQGPHLELSVCSKELWYYFILLHAKYIIFEVECCLYSCTSGKGWPKLTYSTSYMYYIVVCVTLYLFIYYFIYSFIYLFNDLLVYQKWVSQLVS